MIKKQCVYKYILLFLVLVMSYLMCLRACSTKLTYLEYETVNDKNDAYIALSQPGNELEQKFIMPYDILDSISVQLGTFGRTNHSFWLFSIEDSDGKTVYEQKFSASKISDGEYHQLRLTKRLLVNKGDLYTFSIKAQDVTADSAIAFFVSNKTVDSTIPLFNDASQVNSTLCFKVYGGDTDFWWHGFATFCFLWLVAILLRCLYLEKNNKKILKDTILQGLVLAIVFFLLICTFAVSPVFTDETDNMRGGMVIADGGVLYKDYVTQHTPVAYYLCSLFALLGAGSVEQFRLSYYLLEAVIFMILFLRHHKNFGKKKMFFLPLVQTVCMTVLFSPQGYQILSDRIQGILFTALLLEFLQYYKDRKLNWDRCIFVSLCIWGCIGSAFISAYALIFVAIAFMLLEIITLKQNKLTVKDASLRYGKFFIVLLVPFLIAVLYFKLNGALRMAFDQFYTFNREVYPQYTEGFGNDFIAPFIVAIKNLFQLIDDNFIAIITASATKIQLLQFAIVTLALGVSTRLLISKRLLPAILPLFVMVFSGTRGFDFHSMAFWYVAILIIVLNIDTLKGFCTKLGKPIIVVISIILISSYFVLVANNLQYEQPSVSELETEVIKLTEDDENQNIFLDAYSFDSLYFAHKGRKYVNSTVYMLPWYMDWFEQETVDSLVEKQPRVVVYNIDRSTWGISHYNHRFDQTLNQNYSRLGNSDWEYSVWLINE